MGLTQVTIPYDRALVQLIRAMLPASPRRHPDWSVESGELRLCTGEVVALPRRMSSNSLLASLGLAAEVMAFEATLPEPELKISKAYPGWCLWVPEGYYKLAWLKQVQGPGHDGCFW